MKIRLLWFNIEQCNKMEEKSIQLLNPVVKYP